MPDAPTTAAQNAYNEARAAVDAYAAQVGAEHRERYPDPTGPEGEPRWSEEQALLRTAAWTDEENAELDRLRGEASTALKVLLAERAGGE
jgi:hypothetical protein